MAAHSSTLAWKMPWTEEGVVIAQKNNEKETETLLRISKGYEKIKLILENLAVFMSCGVTSDCRN